MYRPESPHLRAVGAARLILRACTVAGCAVVWAIDRELLMPELFPEDGSRFTTALYFLLLLSAVVKLFPFSLTGLNYKRRFARFFIPPEERCRPETLRAAVRRADRGALGFLAFWLAANLTAGGLYLAGAYGKPELLALTLLYWLGDEVCVELFCPYRLLFLSNRCCKDCRIYGWTWGLMFTPMVFVGGFYGWSLFAFGAVTLIWWEMTFRRHPERFFPVSNAALTCARCGGLCAGRRDIRK